MSFWSLLLLPRRPVPPSWPIRADRYQAFKQAAAPRSTCRAGACDPARFDDHIRFLFRLRTPMDRRKLPDNPAILLDHEFAQERASALGRLGRALEAALAALAAFDANHASPA